MPHGMQAAFRCRLLADISWTGHRALTGMLLTRKLDTAATSCSLSRPPRRLRSNRLM